MLLIWSALWLAQTVTPDRPNVVYVTRGTHALKADVFLPKGAGPFPAVLYIHGGGWKGGNKSQFHRHAAHMTAKGFIGVCIEYRFSQEAVWPAAMDDVDAALAWMKKTLPVDANRVAAAGGSAGGQLAAMLGVRAQVKAVAAFNPALDLITLAAKATTDNSVQQYMGGTYAEKQAAWREASPLLQVSAKSAPFLLVHGDADTTVPYEQAVRMKAALEKAGVEAKLFTGTGAAHGFFNRDPWFQPALEAMEKFLLAWLR